MTREYQNGVYSLYPPDDDDQQIALCTNDERCKADADGHDPDCPIERSLQDEFGGF